MKVLFYLFLILVLSIGCISKTKNTKVLLFKKYEFFEMERVFFAENSYSELEKMIKKIKASMLKIKDIKDFDFKLKIKKKLLSRLNILKNKLESFPKNFKKNEYGYYALNKIVPDEEKINRILIDLNSNYNKRVVSDSLQSNKSGCYHKPNLIITFLNNNRNASLKKYCLIFLSINSNVDRCDSISIRYCENLSSFFTKEMVSKLGMNGVKDYYLNSKELKMYMWVK